ncbi:hypothetical protein [Thermomonospora umbrina]|uniref:hypothetical protein n=1 Tax=Thermomonospora umbrina TaxID=111806 RepID=UPI0011C1AA7D|nr:hypothetical protein [Thermomonospora umbrina]
MICHACRDRRHGDCRGGSWCPCQHEARPATPEQERAGDHGTEPTTGGDTGTEPPVNWVRQG